MASKVYTAAELREAADTMDECLKEMESGNDMYWRDDHVTSEDWKAMLRQAADMMEYEEKRERKYEYTLLTSSGHIVGLIPTSEEQARRHMLSGDRPVRREVGEWEEVNE